MTTSSPLRSLKRLCVVPLSCSLLLCLGLGACDSQKQDAAPEPPPAASATAAPQPAPEPADDSTSTLAYQLSEHSQHQKNPTSASTSATAVSSSGTVTVTIKDFTYYCQPAPRFLTAQEAGVLQLTLQKPTGAISRCVEAHDMTLVFAGVDMNAEVSSVEIVGDDNKVLASADVARTR